MKKKVEREITVCDVCGTPCHQSCFNCGIDYCYTHVEDLAVEYRYSISFGGYMDGFYCLDCDTKLRASGEDPLHAAYLTLKTLIDEHSAFYTDFTLRANKAEKRVKDLWETQMGRK